MAETHASPAHEGATPAAADPPDLRALAAQLADVREDHRTRVARKLHDEIGQMLTALRLDLGALALTACNEAQAARIAASIELVGASMKSLRHISDDLRPLLLDDLGLHAALDWLGDQASQRMGIEVTLRRDRDEPMADPRVTTAVYRAVQEALDNIERHARATDVAITLRSANGVLQLTVEDNGLGLPEKPQERQGAWGLRALTERMRALGGRLVLENVRGGGARLCVTLPLQSAGDGAAGRTGAQPMVP